MVEDHEPPGLSVAQGPMLGDPEFGSACGLRGEEGGNAVTVCRQADQPCAGEVDRCRKQRQHLAHERGRVTMHAAPRESRRNVLFEVLVHGRGKGIRIAAERGFVDPANELPISLFLFSGCHCLLLFRV